MRNFRHNHNIRTENTIHDLFFFNEVTTDPLALDHLGFVLRDNVRGFLVLSVMGFGNL